MPVPLGFGSALSNVRERDRNFALNERQVAVQEGLLDINRAKVIAADRDAMTATKLSAWRKNAALLKALGGLLKTASPEGKTAINNQIAKSKAVLDRLAHDLGLSVSAEALEIAARYEPEEQVTVPAGAGRFGAFTGKPTVPATFKPDKPISRIEAEAEAKARGRAAGAPAGGGSEYERLTRNMTPEEKAKFDAKRLDKLVGAEKAEFGNSLEGQSRDAIREYNEYLRRGEQPPPDVIALARQAAHVLNKPRFLRDASGTVYRYTPGITPGMKTPGDGVSSSPSAKRDELESVLGNTTQDSINLSYGRLDRILDILEEAEKAGEAVTGVVGFGKKVAGGLARQAGIPVSPLAKKLDNQLEALKGILGPIILNEKRLSESERARLDKIVGGISPGMDEVDLRNQLLEVTRILQDLESR